MRSDWRSLTSDFKKLIGAYRRGRQRGLGVEDAIAAAGDEMAGIKRAPVSQPPRAAENNPGRFLGLVYAILVNAVSIAGVYLSGWPVGTGLALYWAENVLTGALLLSGIALWRAKQPASAAGRSNGPAAGEVAVITLVFNGAHLLFLLLFLGVMLPRMSAMEAFDRRSFTQGLAFIAILLTLDFLHGAVHIHNTSAVQLQRSVSFYLQRVILVHLTIIVGMFALFLFGDARAFFAVFAALKTVVDITRRL